MFEDQFYRRLIQLRQEKGVSARDMSLSLGQSEAYINRIENQKMLPSMSVFFYICEYLGITPKEFFDLDSAQPEELRHVIEDLKKLDADEFQHIAAIIKGLTKQK